MIIFRPILVPIFLTRFQAPPQTMFVMFSHWQSLCSFSMSSLWHQKQRRVQLPNLSLPQPPDEPKSLCQRLQNLLPSQLQPAKACCMICVTIFPFQYLIHVSVTYATLPLLTCFIICCFSPSHMFHTQPHFIPWYWFHGCAAFHTLLLHSSIHATTMSNLYKLLQ